MTDPIRTALEDMEAFRKAQGWPTPNWMRSTADHLDGLMRGARYGDVLRWVADLCDAALAAPPASPEPERCACGHVHPAPPEPRKMPCVECDCWSHRASPEPERLGDPTCPETHVDGRCVRCGDLTQPAPTPPSVEALRDALLADLAALAFNLRHPSTQAGAKAMVLERLDAIIAAARADERTRRSGIMTAEEYQEAFGEPAALAAASPEPERCATCGQSRDGLKHRCWSTHFRRVREAGDGLHVTTDCHPFQSAPAAPTVEALRDALLSEYADDQHAADLLLDRLIELEAAARADERTRQKP